MLSATLGSIFRHTRLPINVIIAAQTGNLDGGLFEVVKHLRGAYRDSDVTITICEVQDKHIRKGWEHGCILNYVVKKEVSSKYMMTLDSDCMPLVDGWLTRICNHLKNSRDVVTSGILHPWAPPMGLGSKTLEYRVRSQHCWETTHVACQLIRTQDALDMIRVGHGYDDGDDTGLGMVKALKGDGRGRCVGFKPTRCPKPAVKFDAEFNRYSCVVFGDAVLHVGGFTRETVGDDDAVFGRAFGWAPAKILEHGGAEFLLEDKNSYRYTLDREGEISQEKMQRLFGLIAGRMK